MFGTTLPLAERYVRMLAGPGVTRGLLGPREVPRLWTRHVLNCAAVADLVPRPATLIDLGQEPAFRASCWPCCSPMSR